MANRAFGAPRLDQSTVAGPQLTEKKAAPAASALLKASSGATADRIFSFAMLVCGLTVLFLVGLIVYELVTKGSMAWHAFGWKFFFRSDWDPVNDQFGALPFVYGTVVSSILALIIAVPLAVGVARFHH